MMKMEISTVDAQVFEALNLYDEEKGS